MKPKRIAMVCDPIVRQTGGSFNSALRFAELLVKKGHTVIFIAAKYPNSPDVDEYNGIKIYRFRSIKVPKTENQFYISFPKQKQIKEVLIKEKIEILDVVIPTPAAITATRAAKKLGIKIVAHSHTQPENILLSFPKMFQNKFLSKMFYKYLIWIYKKADIIVCPSKFSERLLLEHNPKLKTTVVSNGVPLKLFKLQNPAPFFKKYKLNKKDKQLLFVGRLHPEKNVETLIRAMPEILKHSKVHLNVVGIGYQDEALKKLTKELKINDNVTFYGKLPSEDLLLAYNACDIFILPSLAELEGMVVLEAMACAKPLLIANSKQSASVDFIKGNGYLFETHNKEELAKKTISILNNDSLRKKMGQKSYTTSKEYDIDESIKKIERIYAR